MSKKYNIEGLDILGHNGQLILVYDDGVHPHQRILAYAKSYRELNKTAVTILGGEDWMDFLFYMNEEFPGITIDRLMADMYERHNDTYMSMFKKWHPELMNDKVDDMPGSYEDECENGDCKDGYLVMKVVRTDENGHRWAAFEKETIEKLDEETLYALADDMEIPNYDLKTRAELVNAICAEESDIDSDEYDCTDDCDGNCENCDCADLDDRKKTGTVVPDFHDTGRRTEDGRSIYKYDRNEIEKLSDSQLCDLIDILDVEIDEFDEREDLIDKLCDLSCLVDEAHEDWPQEIKTEAPQDEAQQYESVNGPAHYNGTECIENMRKLFGDEAVRWFCICNAYKYRFRKGNKPGQSATTDEDKAHWYENYAAKMMDEQRYY